MNRKTRSRRAVARDLLLTAFLAAGIVESATAADGVPSGPERIAWRKIPIEIALPVGDERLLHFPEPVKVGLPPQLQTQLRLQSIEGTLYARANASFEATRVLVQGLESGQMYVLDLSASVHGASTTAITVYRSDDPGLGPATHSPADQAEHTPWASPYGYATLTRFAAQQLYAPARLLAPLPAVVRVPVRREAVLLVRGGAVTAEPLVAWRSGIHYLTAVQLTNTSDAPVTLDPRELRGRWLTATFQHNRLQAAGSEADRTVVYLIADRPFADAL
jgi:integrating conjugative element protein (TIGR03749 family)